MRAGIKHGQKWYEEGIVARNHCRQAADRYASATNDIFVHEGAMAVTRGSHADDRTLCVRRYGHNLHPCKKPWPPTRTSHGRWRLLGLCDVGECRRRRCGEEWNELGLGVRKFGIR